MNIQTLIELREGWSNRRLINHLRCLSSQDLAAIMQGESLDSVAYKLRISTQSLNSILKGAKVAGYVAHSMHNSGRAALEEATKVLETVTKPKVNEVQPSNSEFIEIDGQSFPKPKAKLVEEVKQEVKQESLEDLKLRYPKAKEENLAIPDNGYGRYEDGFPKDGLMLNQQFEDELQKQEAKDAAEFRDSTSVSSSIEVSSL